MGGGGILDLGLVWTIGGGRGGGMVVVVGGGWWWHACRGGW